MRALSCIVMAMVISVDAVQAASNPVVTGQAGITDGDTIRMAAAILKEDEGTKELENVRIRFHGIDAPEDGQICFEKDGVPWDCGLAAAQALAKIIGSKEVSCEIRDVDRYKRLVAICAVSGIPDINAELVRRGLAVAYRKYSMDYVADEDFARAAGAGMWRGDFMMPWDWRRSR